MLRCYGEPRRGASGMEFYHPEYQRIDEQAKALDETLTPIYPSTEGFHQASWRKLSRQALALMTKHPPQELLPVDGPYCTIGLAQALNYLHSPPRDADQAQLLEGRHPAQQRLSLEEMVTHHLGLLRLRQQARKIAAPRMTRHAKTVARMLERLPFALTAAQQQVVQEISTDLDSDIPMLR
jgi:ATP-dependent DNA helicase RecG